MTHLIAGMSTKLLGSKTHDVGSIHISFTASVSAILSDIFFFPFFFLQGPIITDLGGLPGSYNEMTLDEFERLLDKMPHLKIMTISPHAEAAVGYKRIKCLLER